MEWVIFLGTIFFGLPFPKIVNEDILMYLIVFRLECGASLASAKGRRKHEKKHCPNMPKDQNLLGGGVGGVPNLYPGNPLMGKSSFLPVKIKQVPDKNHKYKLCPQCLGMAVGLPHPLTTFLLIKK